MFTVQHYEPLYGRLPVSYKSEVMVMAISEINLDLENVCEWSVVVSRRLGYMQVQHFPEYFLRKCGTGCKVGVMSQLALIVSRTVRTLIVILDD